MSKKENKIKGNYGENMACDYLEDSGFEIIARNFNCIYGEIDIIAKEDDEIVFIEVKTRCQNYFGEPIEAIDKNKIQHLYNSAKYFLHKNNLLDKAIRFDVIEVYSPDEEDSKYYLYNLSHTKNIILDMPTKQRRI